MSWKAPEPAPPRPDTTAAGNALVWVFASLVLFTGFLVVVPGLQQQDRTYLVLGLVGFVPSLAGLVVVARARLRYLAEHPDNEERDYTPWRRK